MISPNCLDHDDVMEDVEAKFELSFVDQVEYQKPMHIHTTETNIFYVEKCSSGYTKFMKIDSFDRSAHLKADCFTIQCDIRVCNYLNTQDAGGTISDIGQQFNNLLQNKLGVDVTFEVSGQTLVSHCCVLAARSTVFKTQLFGPMMEESTSTFIQIKGITREVFPALLSFIYIDSFPKIEEEEGQDEEEAEVIITWLQDLLVAADIYDIQQLKFLCERQLSEKIGVSSVTSTLALAEQHHCHRLKEACFKFIQVQSPKFFDKVMATKGWKHMITMYPAVLNELIAKLVSNQKKGKKRKDHRM